MHILHVTPTYIPAYRYGGPIHSVHGLCRSLVQRGHEVDVFTTNVDGPRDMDVPIGKPVSVEGVRVWYFRSRFLRRLYFSPQMADALRQKTRQYDLLHLHSIYLWPTWAAARSAQRVHTPYIVSPRGMLIKELIQKKSRLLKTAWIGLFETSNLENAEAIHATSFLEAREMRRFNLHLPPITVIPNGIEAPVEGPLDSDEQSKFAKWIENRPYILFLGRINWKKGLDRLVKAMAYIPSEIHLVIAGNDEEGYQAVIEALAAKAGVSHRIVFTGPVHGRFKTWLFQKAQAMVLPSYSENFGNTVLEAMACACPVVVTPEVGLADVVRKAQSGWVVDGDPALFGQAVKKLLADANRMHKMGQRGVQTVQTSFAWPVISQQMERMYTDRLNRHGVLQGKHGQKGKVR